MAKITAVVLSLAGLTFAAPTAKTPLGERCAGAPGFPHVEYLGCADSPEAVCVQHPMQPKEPDTFFGRFCLYTDDISRGGDGMRGGEVDMQSGEVKNPVKAMGFAKKAVKRKDGTEKAGAGKSGAGKAGAKNAGAKNAGAKKVAEKKEVVVAEIKTRAEEDGDNENVYEIGNAAGVDGDVEKMSTTVSNEDAEQAENPDYLKEPVAAENTKDSADAIDAKVELAADTMPEKTAKPKADTKYDTKAADSVNGELAAAEGPVIATYPVQEKNIIIKDIFTADASAHVIGDRVYVWSSHDVPVEQHSNDETQYMMQDYALFSLNADMTEVKYHGLQLPVDSVPWASRMMWAPDACCIEGKGCYLYFPAQDKDQVFRIGVAWAKDMYGPYKAEPEPIAGSYSIDPAVFVDDDAAYMVFGGDWGGQLQGWSGGEYDESAPRPTSGDALKPRLAKMGDDMKSFDGDVMEMTIVDADGEELQANDKERRFFEGAWIHKHEDLYYLSYSTGETHKLVYATSKTMEGPWTFEADIMSPPAGWTTHHSIVKAPNNKWYLFYHDASKSGKDSLRNVKMQELIIIAGKIQPMTP